MREACADVFNSWVEAGVKLHEDAGIGPIQARELTIVMIAALEGAFVLARALRSTEPLLIAGEMVAATVDRALAARTG
jgi:hypothetical protein